jgi:hypothetical protein
MSTLPPQTTRIDVEKITQQPRDRLEFLTRFTLFTDDDWAALRESAGVLGPKLPALMDALYEHLLSFDDTRRIFIGQRGEVDPDYLAIRKEHLTDWVIQTISMEKDEFAEWVIRVGQKHTGVAGEPGRVVPPRYMVALSSFVQTAIWSTLFALKPDDPKAVQRMGLAWNKMMIIQLEMMLKVIIPHWPRWDEK